MVYGDRFMQLEDRVGGVLFDEGHCHVEYGAFGCYGLELLEVIDGVANDEGIF
jgi:hypothetical protein